MIDNKTIKNSLSIEDFSLDPSYIYFIFVKYKRILILLPILITFVVYLISKSIPKQYESKASLILTDDAKNLIEIDQVYEDSQILNKSNDINNQIQIIKSNEIKKRLLKDENYKKLITKYDNQKKDNQYNFILKKLGLMNEAKHEINEINDGIFKNFTVFNLKDSDVINLDINTNNPEISQEILTYIINAYLEYDIDQKISITSYANLKINERLNELRSNLEISEKKLHEFKSKNKLIDLGDIKNLKSDEIQSISKRIVKAEQELQKLQNDIQQIKLADGDIDELLSMNVIRDSKEVQNIKSNIDSNQTNIDSLLLVYKDTHPKIQKAIKTSNNLKTDLKRIVDENIAVNAYEMANLENFINLSNAELERARADLQDLELQDLEMQKFLREVNLNQKIYQIFLERLKETNEVKELQTPNAKILDSPSLNLKPVFPNSNKISLFVFISSFLILTVIAIYYELFKKVIGSPESIEANGIDNLGLVPIVDSSETNFSLNHYIADHNSTFAESIKMLQILSLSKFKNSNIFLFTSPMPKEGKTTISFNYALSLAEKYKVLYLELDLRKPGLNNYFNQEFKNKGIQDLFDGKANFSEILLNIKESNLDIISAGNISKNNIFPEDKFKDLLEIIKTQYDYIILDSAPLIPVADTLLIAPYVDVTFFVSKSGSTKVGSLLNSMKKISSVSSCELASIINCYDTKNPSYYEYYNQYGYYKYAD